MPHAAVRPVRLLRKAPALTGSGVRATQAGDGVRATQAGHGVRATQAGHGVRATQAGHGVRATQAGDGVRATQAGDGVRPEVVALAGGVGAARLLQGVVRIVPPEEVVAVVNTGDDLVLHGLHVSPDLDTVTYTLAGAVPPGRGWGLDEESWTVMDALERFGWVAPAGSEAAATWFRLGDRDLATHLYRTGRLAEGATLTEVTAEVAAAWGVPVRVLPMADEPVRTVMDVVGEGEMEFQQYFVRRRHAVEVKAVRFDGVERARPAPGVLEALAACRRVVICPSNPIVSIAPVLAVPGVREAVRARRDDTVAVSPIVAGAAVKGPAARLLAELGHEVSVVGVARLYASVAATLVVDMADAVLAAAVEAEGMRCVVAPAVMRDVSEAAALARTVLASDR